MSSSILLEVRYTKRSMLYESIRSSVGEDMTPLSLYDPRIDPEAAKALIKGDTISILEYEVRIITNGRRIGIDGGIFPGPFKDQELWRPLYQSAMNAINQDADKWIIRNIDTVAIHVMKFPYKLGFFLLSVLMGITDDGRPYLKSEYTPQSDLGKVFINSPTAERARLMTLELTGRFIDMLGAIE